MRAIVAHAPGAPARELRQVVLGSGLDCEAADCVAWHDLAVRLGQSDADVVLVSLEAADDSIWQVLQEAGQLTRSPLLAIGDRSDALVQQRAQQLGVGHIIPPADVRRALDETLERLRREGQVRAQRGRVLSVFAPTPGSGGTTVAVNLAGAMNRRHPDEVAVLELAREFGDIALMLDLEPKVAAEDLCRRWQSLDRGSLAGSMTAHSSGLRVLANPVEQPENRQLTAASARRLTVLARVTFPYTILSLDSRLSEVEVEVMQLSDKVVLVVRPDVPAVRRARWALKEALEQGVDRERWHLVVNRYGQSGQLPLPQIEAALGLKAQQLIPDDPSSVNRAANEGQLLHDRLWFRSIKRRFNRLAGALNGRAG